MTINSILSTLESTAKIIDGREGKERSIKEDFDKEVGIKQAQHDEIVSLTRAYEDADDSVQGFNDEISKCDENIAQLSRDIKRLDDFISRTTDPNRKDRAEKIRDKKVKERDDEQFKREKHRERGVKAEQDRMKAGRKLKKRKVDPATARKALGTMDDKLLANASGGMSKLIGGIMKKSIPIAAISGLVKAIEFGIGKATEYIRLDTENLLRSISSNMRVSINQMTASMNSWEDAVKGAYSAQELAMDSQLAMVEAQNATAMANLKMAHTWTNWIPIWGEVNKYQEAVLEQEQKLQEARLGNAAKILKQVNEFTKKADDYLRVQDKAVHGYQIENGLSSSQTRAFEDRMLGMGETFAKYNKTIEDALKMQSQYAETSGRSVNFSNAEYEKNFAVGRVVGEDNLMNFEAQMNIFNQSVSDSADIMYEMYKDANRMGISQKKLVKDVLGNLKLANKYDFKNGTKGFIELSKWAENARFNLGSLGGALEKVQSGGLEGVIKQSAGLQVLGGSFAMGSNPLSMMFEANADPEAYAKSIQKMFSTMGRFDSKTGETKFNMQENMMMRAAAEQLGISVEDAKNMARGARQKDVVKQQMGGSTLSKEDQDAIANKAQFDKKTGQWYVNTISGGRMNVGDVKEGDLNKILSGNQEEDAKKYAQGTLSTVERIESATKAIAAKLGAATFDNFVSTAEADIHNLLTAYDDNFGEIVATIKDARADASKEQQKTLDALSGIKGLFAQSISIRNTAGQAYSEDKGEDLRIKYGKGEARDNEIDQLKSNASYRSGMSAQEQTKVYNEDTRSWVGKFTDWLTGMKSNNSNWQSDNNTPNNIKAAEASRKGHNEMKTQMWDAAMMAMPDGIVSGNGSPMVVSASNVTPIQDGAVKLAQSDPRDSAIFAKTGGPFDKLFDDIFGKVNALYNLSFGSSSTTNNRYGGDMVQSMLENHFANVFGSSSTTNNRYGGDMVQSMLENHFANVFGSSSTTNNRYGGDMTNTSVNFDPLRIMYDSIGRMNPRTGETGFNMVENMRMAQMARVQGRSIDDIKNDFTRGNYIEPAPERKPREYAMPSTESINELARIASQGNGSSMQQSQGINQPLDVHIYGDLNLKSPTGETINLTNMIQNDPMLIRRITELIINQVGKNVHGGKTEVNRNRFAYT